MTACIKLHIILRTMCITNKTTFLHYWSTNFRFFIYLSLFCAWYCDSSFITFVVYFRNWTYYISYMTSLICFESTIVVNGSAKLIQFSPCLFVPDCNNPLIWYTACYQFHSYSCLIKKNCFRNYMWINCRALLCFWYTVKYRFASKYNNMISNPKCFIQH